MTKSRRKFSSSFKAKVA